MNVVQTDLRAIVTCSRCGSRVELSLTPRAVWLALAGLLGFIAGTAVAILGMLS